MTFIQNIKLKEWGVFNVEESGLTAVQKPPKQLGPKELNNLGDVFCERGKNVILICMFSASGMYVAWLFVFLRK